MVGGLHHFNPCWWGPVGAGAPPLRPPDPFRRLQEHKTQQRWRRFDFVSPSLFGDDASCESWRRPRRQYERVLHVSYVRREARRCVCLLMALC